MHIVAYIESRCTKRTLMHYFQFYCFKSVIYYSAFQCISSALMHLFGTGFMLQSLHYY